jgi:dihydrofolate synthase/folylpolyglutamate synthase
MNYQQTLDYLYLKLPMFTKVGISAFNKNLNNTIAFCEVLENPQHKFKSIHIGGTNGKGSTSHMIAAILQTAGYKTGLYTSPHLKDFRERIKINGEMISEDDVVSFVEQYQEAIEEISPSFFEATVGMAFHYFAQNKVDIAVIEVGLGGRLDSTNIISPEVSVITNIGLDHVNILGNTLQQIAVEKAGIIKPNTPIVIGEYLPETQNIFLEKAEKEKAKIVFAEDIYKIDSKINRTSTTLGIKITDQNKDLDLELDLNGTYQLKNIKAVLEAVKILNDKGFFITDKHIKTALKQVKTLTGFMGRWQTLQVTPLVICDTGHNEDGIKEVIKNINLTPHKKLHIVFGMVKDKDITKVLELMPKNATYYFCAPEIPRAKEVEDLAREAEQTGLKGKAYASVKEALSKAVDAASSEDLIFVGGSTFVVAEVV